MGWQPDDEALARRIEETRRAVSAFGAETPREHRSRERILSELNRLVDPFDREADSVHITGSAIVIGPRGTILLRHKRLGIWLQPGGHAEAHESPPETALREAVEETGVTVRHPEAGPLLIHLDAHPANGHFHLDIRYLLLGDDVDPSPPPGESQAVQWFTLEQATSAADAALVDGLRRVAALQYRW